MKRIVFITDVWGESVNGVVTSLRQTKILLEERGFQVTVIHPGQFVTVPLPTYKEIKLSIATRRKMTKLMEAANPDYVHIATEGPLGFVARIVCMKKRWKFTTFYHTRWPEYVNMRLVGLKLTVYSYLRWFHKPSSKTFVSTESLRQELVKRRFKNVGVCSFGIDLEKYKKNPLAKPIPGLEKPVFVYMGRLAKEKNLPAFLNAKLPGSKLVIGDGPARSELEKKYRSKAMFAGYKTGQELVDMLSVCDVFVFPSKTDTFGLVILEALACDLPVAAYKVQGPEDIITNGVDGILGSDLAANAIACLELNRDRCRQKAMQYSWPLFTETFINNLVRIN